MLQRLDDWLSGAIAQAGPPREGRCAGNAAETAAAPAPPAAAAPAQSKRRDLLGLCERKEHFRMPLELKLSETRHSDGNLDGS